MKNIFKVSKINNELIAIKWGNFECFVKDYLIDSKNGIWLSDLDEKEIESEKMVQLGLLRSFAI